MTHPHLRHMGTADVITRDAERAVAGDVPVRGYILPEFGQVSEANATEVIEKLRPLGRRQDNIIGGGQEKRQGG